MKKTLIAAAALLLGMYLYLYLTRWSYRNEQSLAGRAVYTLFELNTFKTNIRDKNVRVVWSGRDKDGMKGLSAVIYANGSSSVGRIRGSYGGNGVTVYSGKKRIGRFLYMHNPWWETNDYKLLLDSNNKLSLEIDNHVIENQAEDR